MKYGISALIGNIFPFFTNVKLFLSVIFKKNVGERDQMRMMITCGQGFLRPRLRVIPGLLTVGTRAWPLHNWQRACLIRAGRCLRRTGWYGVCDGVAGAYRGAAREYSERLPGTAVDRCNRHKLWQYMSFNPLLSGKSSSCLRMQASSVLSHWITEYIDVFCPYGPAVGCSNLLPADFVRLKNMPE